METISNAVNTAKETATKAIWGEPATGNETAGNEPVSGVQGKGTATEPFDQGNSADPTDPTTRNETVGKEPVSGFQGKGTATEPFDQGNAEDAANPVGKTESAGTTSLPIREKSSSSTPADDLAAKPAIPPADSFNSETAANASTAGQTSAATSPPETSTELKSLDGTANTGLSDTTATGIKPLDTPVTGIKPLDPPSATDSATPAAQGADKPSATPSATEAVAVKSQKLDAEDVLAKPAAGADEPPTKSTGLAGDGGNFDTSKPGAGKEADRLLEEKGVHKDEKGNFEKQPEGGEGAKEKVSKVEKLKEKLHIGHKH